jgi:hypothetical protein
MTQYIGKTILYNLFETALYLNIVQIPISVEPPVPLSRRSKRIAQMQQDPAAKKFALSPYSENLLSFFSPDTQKRLRRDFYEDDQEINKIIERNTIDDPLFIFFDNSGVGIYLELWVCVNIPCPGCNHKLYKYANPGMPVVDVRCINTDHNIGPKYYQIKATQQGKTYRGRQYFSLQEEYICVGSDRFGYNCHVVRADEPIINRQILIGYICIEYNYNDDNHIIIDMTKSFLLIPNLQFVPHNEWTYYHYESTNPIPIIKFNQSMMNVIKFSDKYSPFGIISLSNNYDARKVPTSDAPLPPAFMKYLIMKKKYLDLKKHL